MTLRHVLLCAFWSALLFAFVMATLPKPPAIPTDPGDKVQHVLAFSVLTALAASAYPHARLIIIGLWLSLFGAAIELAQMIPVLHRDAALADWIADAAATAAVLAIVQFFRSRRRTSG